MMRILIRRGKEENDESEITTSYSLLNVTMIRIN